MTNYKSLARRYQGRVRFGYVSYPEEELMAATFEARSLPYTVLIKDGIAYWYRDFPYEANMYKYIEQKGYLNSTTAFYQPRRFVTA